MRTSMVPLGFSGNSFTALVQVTVARSDGAGPIWDVAVSAFSGERTTGEGAGRLIVSSPRVPLIFEKKMRFAPGAFELVSVALRDVAAGIDLPLAAVDLERARRPQLSSIIE